MIRSVPYVYWTRAELPRRQRSMLIVKDFTAILIEPAKRLWPVLSLDSGGVRHEWYLDDEGHVLRELLDEAGRTVSAEDIENVSSDRLYGHYRKRGWWRDHPSSFDLGLEPETKLAASVPSGSPGDFYYIGNAKRHSEVFIRENIISRIHKRAALLRHDQGRLLVRAPLPGYVIQTASGRVWLDNWIPPLSDARASIQGYFPHGRYMFAVDAAIKLSPKAELLPAEPLELYEAVENHPLAEWSAMGATLKSMLFALAETQRVGVPLSAQAEEDRSSAKGAFEMGSRHRFAEKIEICAPHLNYPESLADSVLSADVEPVADDVDWGM